MISKGCFLVLSLVALSANVQPLPARPKRSDDAPPLEGVVNQLSQKLSDVQAQLAALNNEQTQLRSEQAQLKTRFEGSQRKVAFLAYNNKDPFNVADNGIFGYNAFNMNEGHGFDPVSGVFTSPVSGVYVFFVNCMGVTGGVDDVRLMVAGRQVAGCYSSSHEHPETGAAMTAVHMAAGQKAFVKLNGAGRDVRGSFWNTFAGFLLNTED